METQSRLPRYEIRNDGAGPYAIFYCDMCDREYRSQPDIGGAVAQDMGKRAVGGLLRGIPLLGRAVAEGVTGTTDARYSMNMTPQQLSAAWRQVQERFRECSTCGRIVCLSDFDSQSGYCKDDSPRTNEIAEAEGEQVASTIKGIASVFGLGDLARNVSQAAKSAAAGTVRCPKDGTVAPAGTKFCPECGAKIERASTCLSCGTELKGAKFCPECGARAG